MTRGMKRSHRLLPVLLVPWVLLVVVLSAFLGRHWLVEEWYMWRLMNGRDEARQAASEVLDRTGSMRLVPRLLLACSEEDGPDPCCDTLVAIVDRAGTSAVPCLVKGLEDTRTRWNAAYCLGRLGARAKETVPDLVKAMKDGGSEFQVQALLCMRAIGPGAEAVPALVELIEKTSEVEVRYQATAAIGDVGKEAAVAVPQLKRLLADNDPEVRQAAAEALSKIQEATDRGG